MSDFKENIKFIYYVYADLIMTLLFITLLAFLMFEAIHVIGSNDLVGYDCLNYKV